MSVSIPFTQETYRPLCVTGNDTATDPVVFELQAVGGVNKARLKSMLIASAGLDEGAAWSPEVQEAVIKSFETGPGVFVEGVRRISGLTVPARMALAVGIMPSLDGVDPETQIPIKSGYDFSKVSGFWPILAFEIACELSKISGQAEIDPRFFDSLFTSLGISRIPRGTAERVRRARKSAGTAAAKTRKPASSARTT